MSLCAFQFVVCPSTAPVYESATNQRRMARCYRCSPSDAMCLEPQVSARTPRASGPRLPFLRYAVRPWSHFPTPANRDRWWAEAIALPEGARAALPVDPFSKRELRDAVGGAFQDGVCRYMDMSGPTFDSTDGRADTSRAGPCSTRCQ